MLFVTVDELTFFIEQPDEESIALDEMVRCGINEVRVWYTPLKNQIEAHEAKFEGAYRTQMVLHRRTGVL